MSSSVGASSEDMDAAVRGFQSAVDNFTTSAASIARAASNLEASWTGHGYGAFVAAMGQWDKDMEAVSNDLQKLADATRQASTAFTETDASIAKSFHDFGA